MNLHNYQKVIVNSSGGKDSVCALWGVCRLAGEQNYPIDKIVVSHQDLGRMEWRGTKELVAKQSELFGVKTYYSKRRDKNGREETLLEYVERRGKWPSNKQRFCTSDFKRGPGGRVVTEVSRELLKLHNHVDILYVFGFRADESPARAKRPVLSTNTVLSTKSRTVYDWLPIHDWSTEKVWDVIHTNDLPYHHAYDLGMPRLSCVFCIFSPFEALVRAGIENPELLDEYVAVEERIGHNFREKLAIREVRDAIDQGYRPSSLDNWVM